MANQIQIHFPRPGKWGVFTLTVLYSDEGFSKRDTYKPDDIPADLRSALEGVIKAIVKLDAPWRATHVVAVYRPAAEAADAVLDDEGNVLTPAQEAQTEAVLLAVDARRKTDRALGRFTPENCPALCLTDAAVIEAFKHFTYMI